MEFTFGAIVMLIILMVWALVRTNLDGQQVRIVAEFTDLLNRRRWVALLHNGHAVIIREEEFRERVSFNIHNVYVISYSSGPMIVEQASKD